MTTDKEKKPSRPMTVFEKLVLLFLLFIAGVASGETLTGFIAELIFNNFCEV